MKSKAVNPSSSRRMSAQERQWQAECDARTLMDAEKIKGDRARLSSAAAFAKKQAALLSKVGKK